MSVTTVLRLKEHIQNDPEIVAYIGVSLEGDDFTEFATAIHERLPSSVPFPPVYESLAYLAGRPITALELDAAVWRLAGNLQQLRRHHPVHAWNGQSEEEWVPFQVLAVQLQATRRGDLAGEFYCQALAGSPCPMILRKFWTRKFCAFFGRHLGFTSYRRDHPFRDIGEYVNLRFSGLIDPSLCGQMPDFEKLDVTATQLTWNRRYLAMRSRKGHFRCPLDYPLAHPCYLCPQGLDSCPAATHELTFREDYCSGCDSQSYYDPLFPQRTVCVNCHQHELIRQRKAGE
jgi:hypothetical protein